MTPDESRLLNDLLDRLSRLPATAKDPEADALIRAAMIKLPDAPYQLVQAYLLHEQAAAQAKERIQSLEADNQRLRQQLAQPAPAPPQPQPQPGYAPSPWGAPSVPRSGGFLETAAGVAGGMLLAEGVSSLFFGRHGMSPWGFGGGGGFMGGPSIVENNTTIVNETVNNDYGNNDDDGDDGGNDVADDGGWDSGGGDDYA